MGYDPLFLNENGLFELESLALIKGSQDHLVYVNLLFFRIGVHVFHSVACTLQKHLGRSAIKRVLHRLQLFIVDLGGLVLDGRVVRMENCLLIISVDH